MKTVRNILVEAPIVDLYFNQQLVTARVSYGYKDTYKGYDIYIYKGFTLERKNVDAFDEDKYPITFDTGGLYDVHLMGTYKFAITTAGSEGRASIMWFLHKRRYTTYTTFHTKSKGLLLEGIKRSMDTLAHTPVFTSTIMKGLAHVDAPNSHIPYVDVNVHDECGLT